MSLVQIYFILLMFMLLILVNGLIISIRYAPVKIKIVLVAVFLILTMRTCVLILFLIVSDIKYLYLFKAIFISNFIFLPIGAIITLYILWRNEKFKFNYLFLFFSVLIAIYIWCIYKLPIQVMLAEKYGYFMYCIHRNDIELLLFLFNFFILIAGVELLSKVKEGKIGVVLMILSSICSIVEYLLFSIGWTVFPEFVLGQLLWIFTINYSIYKFKNKING